MNLDDLEKVIDDAPPGFNSIAVGYDELRRIIAAIRAADAMRTALEVRSWTNNAEQINASIEAYDQARSAVNA